jgi:hypothetical protein
MWWVYSRLVSADEADALARLATLRRETHQNGGLPISRLLSDFGERISDRNVPGVRLRR